MTGRAQTRGGRGAERGQVLLRVLRASPGHLLQVQRRGLDADLFIVVLVLMRVHGVVKQRPEHPAGVQRRAHRRIQGAVHGGVSQQRAPVEREAQERLRPIGESLHRRIRRHQRERRGAERLAEIVELEQDPRARAELGDQEHQRGGRRHGPGRDRPVPGSSHEFVYVPVPEVVHGAPRAPQQERARAEQRRQVRVGRTPRRGGECDGPQARPREQVHSRGSVQSHQLGVRHREGRQRLVDPRALSLGGAREPVAARRHGRGIAGVHPIRIVIVRLARGDVDAIGRVSAPPRRRGDGVPPRAIDRWDADPRRSGRLDADARERATAFGRFIEGPIARARGYISSPTLAEPPETSRCRPLPRARATPSPMLRGRRLDERLATRQLPPRGDQRAPHVSQT